MTILESILKKVKINNFMDSEKLDKIHVDKERTHIWLVRGNLKPETKGNITAALDQALRIFHYEKYILKSS
jgi:hypothetical protein